MHFKVRRTTKFQKVRLARARWDERREPHARLNVSRRAFASRFDATRRMCVRFV